VSVTDDDGYSYVYVPHIRYGFYVYTYAYGHLVSNLMLQKYQADPGYLTQINQFLHAGGSDTVENIFKNIGINTRQVGTFLDSLKSQEKEIKELERLTKK
jgi:oligoendopeptidase F